MAGPFRSDDRQPADDDRRSYGEEDGGRRDSSERDGSVTDDPDERRTTRDERSLVTDGRGPTVDATEEGPSIELRDRAPLDEPVQPVLTGLEPFQRVALRYETSDPDDGTVWSGSATFEADDRGVVDLASAAPRSGSYDAADPTGPLWSMEPDLPPERAQFEYGTHEVEFAVDAVDGEADATSARPTDGDGRRGQSREPIATATTTRVLPDVETSSLPGNLVGTIYLPPIDRPAPAVLVLHGSSATELDHVARLLANRGFAATTLKYFGEEPALPSELVGVPLEYVQRAVDALREREDTLDSGVGLHGVSKGGELALLAGAHLEGIDAVVSVAGSSFVWEGLTRSWQPAGRSSWSVGGDPIDAVPFPEASEDATPPAEIRDSYERALEEADEATLESAAIPVEEIRAPTLLVSGDRDAMWPSTRFARTATERLGREDVAFAYEHRRYEDAGHGIAPPHVPTYGRAATPYFPLGGTPSGNAAAAADHWSAVVEHFDRALETA